MNKEGLGTIIGLGIIAAVLGFLGFVYSTPPVIVFFWFDVILFLFSIYFFRDPQRIPPDDPHIIVSPADGRIILVVDEHERDFLKERVTRISIFLSLFDVHVNYTPYEGAVDYVRYNRGKNYRANSDRAFAENANAFVGLVTPYGKLAFRQSTGLFTRRIVCRLRIGEHVKTGQKYGMIKFGSRMDVYLPSWAQISCKVGDRLRAGESVIARIDEN